MLAETVVSSRADTRRAAIVGIARDVFLEQGYAATSMSTIASRVGGSKGTLYSYFKSKEELFAAFMAQECAAEAAVAFDFSDHDGDLRATLCRAGERFLRFVLSAKVIAVHRLVIGEGGRFPELGLTFYESGPRLAIDRLTALLEGEAQAGRVRPDANLRRAAEQFLELVKSGLHQRRMWGVIGDPDETEIAANVEAAVTLWLVAYGDPEPA